MQQREYRTSLVGFTCMGIKRFYSKHVVVSLWFICCYNYVIGFRVCLRFSDIVFVPFLVFQRGLFFFKFNSILVSMWVTLFVCVKSGLSHGAMGWPWVGLCLWHFLTMLTFD